MPRLGDGGRRGGRFSEGGDQEEAGGVEHARLGVDRFAVVLGANQGMVAAQGVADAVDMQAVGGDQPADIIGGVIEDALEAIHLLVAQGGAAFAFEEGIGGPGRAPENAGGVGAGGHGVEILIELGGQNRLGLIDREEKVGGGPDDLGARFAGEELKAGSPQDVHVALGGLPDAARADAGIERGFDAVHVVGGLGFEGGRDGNDAPTDPGIAEQEPGEEMGLELVLARLAGKDHDKGEAAIMKDRILDGQGDLALIGTKRHLTGGGPGQRTAADGLTEAGGERGGHGVGGNW